MKKPRVIILIATLSFVGISSVAQEYRTAVSLDLMPGVPVDYRRTTYSTYHPNLVRLSMSMGIGVQHLFGSKRFGIEAGLYILDRGYRKKVVWDNSVNHGIDTQFYYAYYLSMPISLRFSGNHVFMTAGGQANYQVRYKFVGFETTVGRKTRAPYQAPLGVQLSVGYRTRLGPQGEASVAAYLNSAVKVAMINYGLLFRISRFIN